MAWFNLVCDENTVKRTKRGTCDECYPHVVRVSPLYTHSFSMNGNTEEETNFLNDLLAGIDADEILNAVPTPVTTPAKKRQRPKSPIKSPEKENWSAQDLDNVGWEWDIDEDDFLTPIKRKKVDLFSFCRVAAY